MNSTAIYLFLALKLIDGGIDPATLRVETYRDPMSFNTICRGMITRGTETLSFQYQVSDEDEQNREIDRIVADRAFHMLRERIFPDRHDWIVQTYNRLEAMVTPRPVYPGFNARATPRPTDTFEATGEE